MFLKIWQNSQEKNLYRSVFFNNVSGWSAATFSKETLAQVVSYKFCEIFKNTSFTEKLQNTVSVNCQGESTTLTLGFLAKFFVKYIILTRLGYYLIFRDVQRIQLGIQL